MLRFAATSSLSKAMPQLWPLYAAIGIHCPCISWPSCYRCWNPLQIVRYSLLRHSCGRFPPSLVSTALLVLLLREDDCCCRCLELLWTASAETGSYIGQIACFKLQGIWFCRPCLGSDHITTNQRSNFSFWQGLTLLNSTIVWIIKLQVTFFGNNRRRFSNLLLQERRKSIEY